MIADVDGRGRGRGQRAGCRRVSPVRFGRDRVPRAQQVPRRRAGRARSDRAVRGDRARRRPVGWCGRSLGVVAAVVVVLGGAYLIRSMRRQAIIVDGDRLGLAARADVEDQSAGPTSTTSRRRRSPRCRRRSPASGPTSSCGPAPAGCRASTPSCSARSCRPTCAGNSMHRAGSTEPLNPFIVPFSALPEHGRTAIRELLAARGLLPG